MVKSPVSLKAFSRRKAKEEARVSILRNENGRASHVEDARPFAL